MTETKVSFLFNKPTVHLLFISFLSLASFLPGLSDNFVFDDQAAVRDNKDIYTTNLADIFKHDFWGGNISGSSSHKSYRPLTTLTFWLQSRLDGRMSVMHLKLGNMFLHLIVSVLVYQMCLSFGVFSSCESLSATAIFACHPIHTESIVSAVGRADLLYSAVFCSSVIFSFRWGPCHGSEIVIKYFVLLILTLVSMLFKEQGITFLAFLFVIEFSKFRRKNKLWFNLHFILILLCISFSCGFLLYFRLWIVNFQKPTFVQGDNPAAAESDLSKRWLTFHYLLALNFWIFLAPVWLCFDWALGCIPLVTLLDPRIIFITIFWILFLSLAVKAFVALRKSSYSTLFALSLLVFPFIPSSNLFVYVGFVIAERNLYLSLIGYALLVTKGLSKLSKASNPKKKSNFTICSIFCIVILTLLCRSRLRSAEWTTEIDLFLSGLKVCPSNAKIHYNIAKTMSNNGSNADLAVKFYKEAIRLEPQYEHALNNLGNLLKSQGKFSESSLFLNRAIDVNPKFAAAFMNLAIVEQATGNFSQSERHYLNALSLRSPYPDCEYNLGNLYLKLRRLDEAEYMLGLSARRGHQLGMANLLILLDERRRYEECEVMARKAVVDNPENAEFRFHLANCLGQQEKYEDSETFYKSAISLKPKALYFGNLGVLYHRWGKKHLALQAYKEALRLDSGLISARVNFEKLQGS